MNKVGKSKISLLAFDLDGTLLNGSYEISKYTLQQIHEAMELGVKVTISSARIPSMQQVFISQLGFNGPYIASNGALIRNSRDNSVLHSRPIKNHVLTSLCAFSIRRNLHLCLQTEGTLFFTEGNPRVARLEQYNLVAAKHGFPEAPMRYLYSNYSNYDKSPTYKVLIYAPEEAEYKELIRYLDQEKNLVYTFSEPYLFDITPRGTDKGIGIEAVAGYYDIPLQEVCAFGDYDNDIPIFAKVGTAIAMANASDSLKEHATYITDSNENDGVGKAIAAMRRCFQTS